MIAWEEISANHTISQTTTWYGTKGYSVYIAANGQTLTFEPPGDKVGAEVWVAVNGRGDPSWTLLFIGSPTSALEPEANNAWFIQGTSVVCRFLAISPEKWIISVPNGANVL